MKKANIITIISVIAVVLILAIQAFLISENFKDTRSLLTLETTNILEKAYKHEVSIRGIGQITSDNMPERLKRFQERFPDPADFEKATEEDIIEIFDLDSTKIKEIEQFEENNDVQGMINMIMNMIFEMPTDKYLQGIDSIVGIELKNRNIHSDYVVRLVNQRDNKVVEQSKQFDSSSKLLIRSTYIQTDVFNEKSLQLILVNPFIAVFQRMGALVATSLVLALLSFYGLWFLFRTLARQKKLLELKNDFFSNTAHELKRPVAQLNMAIDRLSSTQVNENEAKRTRYLAISQSAVNDMSQKIDMLMTLAMEEEGVFRLNVTRFNLSEVIRRLAEQFTATATKEVNIDFSKVSDNVYINGDETHIRQCIANLIDNAIKYSGNAVDIIISLLQKGEEVLVSVKDNGTGFPPEKAELIFEKYNRLGTEKEKPAGFGIGLSYVKTIMEKHKGKISVNSEEGKGSEFVLQF